MLRMLRVFLATFCFAGICLLFLDTGGELAPRLAPLATLQFVPALLRASVVVAVALCLLTLLFGRVYCSILCPLGVLQDLISRLGKKKRFRFSRGKTLLRAAALLVFILAFLSGTTLLFSLLEPYSAFGRIAAHLLAPVWQAGGNVLAIICERADSFLIGPTPVWQKGLFPLAAGVSTLALIGLLAWRSGRTWCNTLCPVGAFLGLVGHFSFFRPRIDAATCASCGACAGTCKASCIDAENAAIDASRCVSCFNCLGSCKRGAISYSFRQEKTAKKEKDAAPMPARRAFLAAGLGLLTLPAAAAAGNPDAKAPDLSRKKRPIRAIPVLPPGALSLRNFTEHCTGCQLCVSACPHQVLSAFESGSAMLQPALSFEHGFCRVNCVACSQVCPTGAIRPISAAQKSATQIGRARVETERCIMHTDNVDCTACSRVCPSGAAVLVNANDGRKRLVVDAERCLGCGACEYVCPAHPLAAIQVEGNREHRRI
jgi:polyferredoxin